MLNTVYRFQTSAWRSSRAGESGRKHSPASSCFGKWSSVVSRYPQPALQESRRITIYDVVSCCNMQLLDLDLRPMCNLLLQTNALVQDEWDAEKIFPLHTRFSGQHAGLRQKKPPTGAIRQGQILIFCGIHRREQHRKIQTVVVQSLGYICGIAAVKPESDLRQWKLPRRSAWNLRSIPVPFFQQCDDLVGPFSQQNALLGQCDLSLPANEQLLPDLLLQPHELLG